MQSFSGIVQRGSRRATALGYPTINLAVDNPELSGVYAARVTLPGGVVKEAAAFADPSRALLEAHVFGLSEELYGKEATIELHKKIREGRAFESDEALKAAIARDVADVREYFHL